MSPVPENTKTTLAGELLEPFKISIFPLTFFKNSSVSLATIAIRF